MNLGVSESLSLLFVFGLGEEGGQDRSCERKWGGVMGSSKLRHWIWRANARKGADEFVLRLDLERRKEKGTQAAKKIG